ncbi:hypothetical protein LUZ60_012893 [Juncus effusus]|nr:hypothetical protein LUZ60_012893 [Juncus effusus]
MEEQIIRFNVGGSYFETTARTLHSAAAISASEPPPFIDRDPSVFSALLSLLRSTRLPPSSPFSNQFLIKEAAHYGLQSRIRSAMAPPPLLGFDASLTTRLVPSSDALATSFSAGPDGSVWLAHGGQISCYDWSLSYSGSLRTHLDHITSLSRINCQIGAVGSVDSPGLHLCNMAGGGAHVGTIRWTDQSDPRTHKAHVTAIAPCYSSSSPNEEEGTVGPLFAAFECQHKENCILSVDPTTLQITSEIGRQSGNAAKSAAPNRLVHLQEPGVVFVSSVTGGAFGYSGYMRLWDPRSGDTVWETSEPGGATRNSSRFGDSFSDVDADKDQMAIYKVCSKSGDVGVADLRKLGNDPWVYLSDGVKAMDGGGGENSVICCYKRQAFLSRESGLEVWSQLGGDDVCKRRHRRNMVDTEDDAKRGMINRMEGGGDRLFLSRQGMEGVEVWESSRLSRAVSLH